jgi:hypothetical protein
MPPLSVFCASVQKPVFDFSWSEPAKNAPSTRDLDTRLSILMIHISLFLIRVHFNLLLNYLPPNITTITCSCDARFCSPRAAFAYKYSGALQHLRAAPANDVI